VGLVIVTVTPNPAYDVTYEVASLSPGEVHRVSTVRRRPGGKGVNVAAVLASLGTPVIATGLATTGFGQDVERIGVRAAFVAALPRVRSTLAISHGPTTSLWEPGVAPRDPVAAAAALEAEVARLLVDAHCLVVSGSLPPGVDPALPVALARLAREHGLPCVLDVAGEALGLAADGPGVVLMPNAEELAELCGPSRSLVEVADASRRLLERGPSMVFATRGAEGLVLTTSEGSWQVPAVPGVRETRRVPATRRPRRLRGAWPRATRRWPRRRRPWRWPPPPWPRRLRASSTCRSISGSGPASPLSR
jgi:tagatose 6-phosphate kinase